MSTRPRFSSLDIITVPGQPVGDTSSFLAGTGVHTRFDTVITASIVGKLISNDLTAPTTISVKPAANFETARLSQSRLPEVGSVVMARVTRINPRQATLNIISVDDQTCKPGEGFIGVIRVQDVRATEKDKIKIGSSFRPGDIVRAVVISLGDQSSYYLTTSKNELGVVVAHTDAGDLLYPRSWKDMVCSRTGNVEERKVARPAV